MGAQQSEGVSDINSSRRGSGCRSRLWLVAALAAWLALGAAAAGQARVPGDLNDDGAVDAADRLLMRHLLAENIGLSDVVAANADVNEDGVFRGVDGAWLLLLDPPYRGGLIDIQPAETLSRSQATFLLNVYGMSQLAPAQYDTDRYVVQYRTVSPWGGVVPASGLLALPRGRTGALPWVSLQHGTQTRRIDTPSNLDSVDGLGTAIIYPASGGYAAVAADYLGFGTGPGRHPYVHADTEASAALDLMRAARSVAGSYGVTLTGPLFLAGYSQGGHATMALHRELERRFGDEYPVTASAPMAGPYDLSETTLDFMLDGAPEDSVMTTYLAFGLYAYHLVYGIGPTLADIFQPPYAAMMDDFFDGTHSFAEIAAVLPPRYSDLLQPALVEALNADPNHPYRLAMRLNDVYDWLPAAPLRMYHSAADTVVPIANAEVALARMTALGADVDLVVVSQTLGHGDAAVPCLIQSRFWFDEFVNR